MNPWVSWKYLNFMVFFDLFKLSLQGFLGPGFFCFLRHCLHYRTLSPALKMVQKWQNYAFPYQAGKWGEKICSPKIKPAVKIPHDQCVNGKGLKEVCCCCVFAPFSSQKFYTQQSIICALAYSFSGGGDILSLAASFCVKSHEQAIFSLPHRLEHWCNGFVPFTVWFSISKEPLMEKTFWMRSNVCVSPHSYRQFTNNILLGWV